MTSDVFNVYEEIVVTIPPDLQSFLRPKATTGDAKELKPET